jgi:hypothetical protein
LIIQNVFYAFEANYDVVQGFGMFLAKPPHILHAKLCKKGAAHSRSFGGNLLVADIPAETGSSVAQPGRTDRESARPAAYFQEFLGICPSWEALLKPSPTIQNHRIGCD